MNRVQKQGLIFGVVAILIALGSALAPALDPLTSLILIATLIFFLGVPHGALDPCFAEKLFAVKGWQAWSLFVLIYLGLAGGVVIVWWLAPLVFMTGFLLISILHFSRDLSPTTPRITRLLYGGAMIVLPALFHFSEMLALFTLIIPAENAQTIMGVLHTLAWPWAAALALALCVELSKNWRSSFEIFSVSLLATAAQPLIAFTVYFCGMHSLRHMLRTQQYVNLPASRLLWTCLSPMLGVSVLVALGWFYLPASSFDSRILQFVFVTLAALTVPHMLLVDRARYSSPP
jgi:Brp/Blh family beta-carotene 15,15'-monooxygenase